MLTKREALAGMAMQGILARGSEHIDGIGDCEAWSRLAVEYADALILELESSSSPKQ